MSKKDLKHKADELSARVAADLKETASFIQRKERKIKAVPLQKELFADFYLPEKNEKLARLCFSSLIEPVNYDELFGGPENGEKQNTGDGCGYD